MPQRIEPGFNSAPLLKRKDFSSTREERHVSNPAVKRRYWPWLLAFALLLLLLAAWQETRTSFYQSQLLHRLGQKLSSELQPGPSSAIHFPESGPYNQQRGYSLAEQWQERLAQRGFEVVQQQKFSPTLLRYSQMGFFPPYEEKQQAGLLLRDCQQQTIYQFSYPQRQFASLLDMPPLLPELLTYIENKSLLTAPSPFHNPAIEWPRLGAALLSQSQQWLGNNDNASGGGSTLATQLEKYRHSPAGRTHSVGDKFKQMLSASIRAYKDSPVTAAHRQRLVLHYLNTVPLAAAPGYGEVHGIPDGLWAWFGADYRQVSHLLTELEATRETATALNQVLALMIAQRRPSFIFAARAPTTGTIGAVVFAITDSGWRYQSAAGRSGQQNAA